MKKNLLLLLLTLQTMVANADAVEIDGIYYNLFAKGNVAEVKSNPNKYTGTVSIPEKVFYNNVVYKVTSIGDYAFYDCRVLTSIVIPNSVTSIGSWAFHLCSGLTSIDIPNSVTSIGSYAFYCCSGLTSINISEGVTTIGETAFAGCGHLTSVTIPNSVTSIGDNAFEHCSGLTSITIGNSVTSIGAEAFMDCSSLTSVHISDLAAWCNISFSDNPLHYAHHLFLNGTEIKDLVIPNSVTSIGERAFRGCSGLTSVTIPNSVSSIGSYAFWDCSGLTSVTIPNSVTSIGSRAFYGCSGLTSITIPNSVASIGSGAFNGCSGLTSVTIPNSVSSIGSYAFWDCSGLTSVTIPNSVTSIGSRAFYGCSGLTSITIPNSVASIGSGAFYGCSKVSVIKIPDNIKIIEKGTFQGCSSLKSLVIPASVEFIYQEAFANCTRLESVKAMPETPPFLYDNSFTNYNIPLYAPESAIQSYQAQSPWSKFAQFKTLDGTEIEIKKCATPTIAFKDGKLSFNCATEDVQFAYQITDSDIRQGNAAEVSLSTAYNVSVYATKPGYDNSDVATATFSWNGIEPLIEGSVAKYRLSFIVDNKELSNRNVEYGATITPPVKDGNGNTISWYTYPATMPAHDLVVYGMTMKEPEEPEPIVPEPEVFVWLTVNDCQSGYTKIKVKQGAEQELNFTAEEGWKISNIFMDGRYVTSRLAEDGTFVTPAITGDASIIVVYEEVMPSGVRAASRSQADVKVVSDGVVISNAEPDTRCVVYQTDGKQVVNTVINEGTRKITLQKGQAYILTIDGRTLKFAL